LSAVDRSGNATPLLPRVTFDAPENPRVSPDGRRFAVIVGGQLWVYDLSGRPPIKLTFEDRKGGGRVYSPLWTADGRRIVYEKGGGERRSLYSVPADGGGMPEPIGPEGHYHPHGWTAEGRELVAARVANNSADLVRFSTAADAKVQDVLVTPGGEGFAGSVSPDGRWLAYTADPTGRTEIWVRPLDGSGPAVRVSPNGGGEPLWAKNGRELFYLEDRKLMAIAVEPGSQFNFQSPVALFTSTIVRSNQPPSYDVMPDGRFVMFASDDMADLPISVVLNWTRLLQDRAAAH
jgi:Tol biopolymer transport system component